MPSPNEPAEGEPRLDALRATSASVVVASIRHPRLIEACLRSVLPEATRIGADVVVARDSSWDDIASLATMFPTVRFFPAPPGSSLPVVRGIGLAASLGDLVALTEDHCVVDDRWLGELTAHADPGVDVIGGGMDNAQRQRVVEWGAFFSEYGLYASTRAAAPSSQLTAANVAYHRRVVGDVARWSQEGDWEHAIHDRLAARGANMRFLPSATVLQNLTYTMRGFMADRFSHGFNFARKRAQGRPIMWRIPIALLTPVLPAIFCLRLARTASAGRRLTFVRALPATATFLAAWALGEAAGYLAGPGRVEG